MPARTAALDALDRGLDGAVLWGLELDTRYRVLAGTFEPTTDHHPHGEAPDRRLQVVFFPCAAIKARLVRDDDGEATIERFEVDQLVDVVENLGGAVVRPPLFDRGEPAWGADVSLRGETSAADGRSHDLTLVLEGNGRRLGIWATFDEVQVLTPEGEDVPITLFRA